MMTNLLGYLRYVIYVISNLSYNADNKMIGMEIRSDGELIYKKGAIILRDGRITIDTRRFL